MFIVITSRVGVANSSVFYFDVSSHFHLVFLSRPSDVAKTVFSSFLHLSSCGNHCMLFHVFFYISHRFFICRFHFNILASFLLSFIVFASRFLTCQLLLKLLLSSSSFHRVFENLYFCSFSWLFG